MTHEIENSTDITTIEDTETDKYFRVDYCKRSTTKCKKCKKTVHKDELRIGKLVPFKQKYIYQYYHPKCAFHAFEKARTKNNAITSIDDMDGFFTIRDDDTVILLI